MEKTKVQKKAKTSGKVKAVKFYRDSNGVPWPDFPIDKAKMKRIESENRQNIQDELKTIYDQTQIHNEYFRKWKYLEELSQPNATRFFEGELYKFEHIYTSWNDPLWKAICPHEFPSAWKKVNDAYKQSIDTLKRYLEEIKGAGTGNPAQGEKPRSQLEGPSSRDEWVSVPEINVIFLFYPEFKTDLLLLKDNGYIAINDNKITWLKSKKSLAEYFGFQNANKNTKWEAVEKVFNVTNLKHSFSSNGGTIRTSKHYNEWIRIKDLLKSKQHSPVCK